MKNISTENYKIIFEYNVTDVTYQYRCDLVLDVKFWIVSVSLHVDSCIYVLPIKTSHQ